MTQKVGEEKDTVTTELKHEVRKTFRAEFEEWVARRHWGWLVLIVALVTMYNELPNPPIAIDGWITSVALVAAGSELLRRIRQRWDEIRADIVGAWSVFRGRIASGWSAFRGWFAAKFRGKPNSYRA